MKGIASFLDGRGGDDIFPTHYRLNKARDIQRFATESGLVIRFIRHVECTAQGVMLGPLVMLELLVIRALRLPIFENYRSDLLVMLEKPGNVDPAIDTMIQVHRSFVIADARWYYVPQRLPIYPVGGCRCGQDLVLFIRNSCGGG